MRLFCLVVACVFWPLQAFAVPSVAVSPANAGVVSGAELVVEVLIADVKPGAPLEAFALDLVFDPTHLQATRVESAGFLARSPRTLHSALAPGRVEFAAASLGHAGEGDGVLARVRFQALAPGAGTLSLEHVKLSSLSGISLHPGAPELPPQSLNDAHYTVPEPSQGVLALAAWLALLALGRAQRVRLARAAVAPERPRWAVALARRTTASHRLRAVARFALMALLLASSLVAPVSPALASDPDLDDDGVVGVFDAAIVSSCWGGVPAECDAHSDVDGDGHVGTSDLDAVVAHWGESGFPVTPPGDRAPVVRIVTPGDGSAVASSPIDVHGLVGDPGASVSVNGVVAAPDPEGLFVATGIGLLEGDNTVQARASDTTGHAGSHVVHVLLDTSPPVLQLAAPPGGRWQSDGVLFSLHGTLEDNRAPVLDPQTARVVVHGPLYTMAADVHDGGFWLSDFVLPPGRDTLQIVATDAAGNSVLQSIVVSVMPSIPPPNGTPSLRILTYNTAFLSAHIHIDPSLVLPSGFDYILEPNDGVFGGLGYEERAARIAEGILRGDQDVVVLNEVFSDKARNVLVNLLAGSGRYPHYVAKLAAPPLGEVDSLASFLAMLVVDSPHASATDLPDVPGILDAGVYPGDSGLMIFSRYPLLPLTGAPNEADCADSDCVFAGWNGGAPLAANEVAFHLYRECDGMDCYASKGAGLVEIDAPAGPIHVVFTHMQADEASESSGLRNQQYQEVRQLLFDSVSSSELVIRPLFVAGDLNTIGENKQTFSSHSEWYQVYHPDTPADRFFACGNDMPCFLASDDLLTDPWAFETSPDDLGHSQIDDDARLDYILHNDPDDTLCMQHIMIAWDVAENGTVWYSDHKPMRADYNLRASRCTPNRDANPLYAPLEISFPSAQCDSDPNSPPPPCQQDLAYFGSIQYPGSFQWYLITQPGSYSIKVTPAIASERVAFEVYARDDLSRPIAPFEKKEHPRWGIPYLMLDPPYYVRVYAVDNSTPVAEPDRTAESRDYTIHFHQHLCRSAEDACMLPPGDEEHPAFWPAITPINPAYALWFRFKTGGVRNGHLDPAPSGYPQIAFREEADISNDLDCLDPPVVEKYDDSDPPVLLESYPVGPVEFDPDDQSWDDDPYLDQRYPGPDLDTDTLDELRTYRLKLRRPGGFVCDAELHTRVSYGTTLSYFLPTKVRNYSDAAERLTFRSFFDIPLAGLPSDDALIASCPTDPLCRPRDGEVIYLSSEVALRGYFVSQVVPMVIGSDPVPPFVLKNLGQPYSHSVLGFREKMPPDEAIFYYKDGPNPDEANYYSAHYYRVCHDENECRPQ